MEEWDQETLEKVVESKKNEYQQNKPTDIVSYLQGSLYNMLPSSQLHTCLLNIDVRTINVLGRLLNEFLFCFWIYVKVCKYFLEAVEKKQYGWF